MRQRILHIILAFVLLLSATGLVKSQHFCQGMLKSTAYFVEASPCHAQKQMPHCPLHGNQDDQEKEKNCCDTETELIKSEHDALAGGIQLQVVEHSLVLAIWDVAVPTAFLWPNHDTYPVLYYKPPLLIYDLPVRLQTFLC